MSLICRMVVGYFEPAQAYGRDVVIDRPLSQEAVQRLQSACEALFSIELRLADYLTEEGIVIIVDGVITRDMFRVACVAHELFGMAAVDNAHFRVVYPRPDWEPESFGSLMQSYRRFRPDWDEAQVWQAAESAREGQLRRAEFERGVIRRVFARLLDQHHRPSP